LKKNITAAATPEAAINGPTSGSQLHSGPQLPSQKRIKISDISAARIPASPSAMLMPVLTLLASAKNRRIPKKTIATPVPYSAFAAQMHRAIVLWHQGQIVSIKFGKHAINAPEMIADIPVIILFFKTTPPRVSRVIFAGERLISLKTLSFT
jgi:hypothetical protein